MTIAERQAPSTDVGSDEPLHRRLGITDEELEAIRDRLAGREPNELELAMFSVMWSEHCSYKSSKPLLATLPTAGAGVVAGPGENAGVISIGDGLAVAFKIESHNHPSAVEPYQGAATGVGGILRDIFTMGARPIAILDALRFGDPSDARTRHLVDGVVGGVGGYGNCVGIPTVGGELVFDPSYQGNPLVNVMAVGVLEERHLTRAAAPGPGNLVVLFGSTTGRDGIGGASVLASATFSDGDASKRPSVQVGDPFAEKLLIEASLELIEQGLIEGLQDLGAGGITCATSETADRAGTGIAVDLDAIPLREPGMAPFEVMISESQERMCAIVRPARLDDVRDVAVRWGLPVAVIGRVTDDGDITVASGGAELARIPAAALTSEAIVHQRAARAPEHRRAAPAPGAPTGASDRLPERGMDPGAVLLALLGSPNLASRRSVYERYDSTVGTDTVVGPGHGAAVMRIKGTTRALVATTDGNATVGALDPYLGAAMSVAEATRNVSITGARPLGVTNCLNYGDPTRPEAFWQLSEGVRGLGDACRALGLPVTGGNVSLYNESPAGAIAPTPEIGVVGTDRRRHAARGSGLRRRRGHDRHGRRGDLGARRVGVRRARRDDRRGRPAVARPRARGRGPGIRPRCDRPRTREQRAGRLRRRSRRRPRGGVDVGWHRRLGPRPDIDVAGRRAVRRGPIADSRHRDGAPRGGADAARPPTRPARGDARRRRRRSTPDPACRDELDRRLGGAWQHDRRCARRPRHGASARLGPRLGPRPRLGRRLSRVRRVRGSASRR